jgi:hypothetical protein
LAAIGDGWADGAWAERSWIIGTGAVFNASTHMERGGNLTGLANGKAGTVAARFKVNGSSGVYATLITTSFAMFYLSRKSDNVLEAQGWAPSWASKPLQITSTTSVTSSTGKKR